MKTVLVCAAQAPFIVGGAEILVSELRQNLERRGFRADVANVPFKWYPVSEIVRQALSSPLRQIAVNAGLDGAVVLSRVADKEGDFGFNAASEEYGDLVNQGIIDPAKVVRAALQNAASVSGLLLTTETAVVEEPQPAPPMPPGGDMGGMGGMGGMGDMGGMGF